MHVVVLKAGIFPDRESIEEALSRLPGDCRQSVFEVSRTGGCVHDWDQVLDQMLCADRIIVV